MKLSIDGCYLSSWLRRVGRGGFLNEAGVRVGNQSGDACNNLLRFAVPNRNYLHQVSVDI